MQSEQPMASRDSYFRTGERAIDVILLAAIVVIAIFDPGWVGKIAIPVIWVVLGV